LFLRMVPLTPANFALYIMKAPSSLRYVKNPAKQKADSPAGPSIKLSAKKCGARRKDEYNTSSVKVKRIR